jgi:hypothetical protein
MDGGGDDDISYGGTGVYGEDRSDDTLFSRPGDDGLSAPGDDQLFGDDGADILTGDGQTGQQEPPGTSDLGD